MNTLYYGDNLKILRDYIKDEAVDLIYLDPPSNSNRSYNVLFKDESGTEVDSQIHAFEDTWHWNLKVDSETVASRPGEFSRGALAHGRRLHKSARRVSDRMNGSPVQAVTDVTATISSPPTVG